MNGKFLLDTNIILGFLKGSPSIVAWVNSLEPESLYASVITRMELLSFHGITPGEEGLIRDFLGLVSVVPLNTDVESIAIALRLESRRKMPDAIVAASAIFLQAVLVTCDRELTNTKFPGLETFHPDVSA